MKTTISTFIVVFLFGFLSPAWAVFPIVSTFDADAEGWTADGALVSQIAAGGNPGGFLRLEDNQDNTFSAFAPEKFLGDLSAFNGGQITYDILVLDPTTPLGNIGSGFGRIQLLGGGSNATFDYAGNPMVPSSQFWTKYYVLMTAQAWNTTPENWATVLSDVTKIDIILEPTGGATVGLDNFRLHPVPEPATVLLFGAGLIGLL